MRRSAAWATRKRARAPTRTRAPTTARTTTRADQRPGLPSDDEARDRPLMEAAASADRAWLEAMLDMLPTAALLIEPRTGVATFANRAADRLAGGRFPLGPAAARSMSDQFRARYPDGRPIPEDELPTIRAAQGQRVERFEFDWETPSGTRSLLVHGAPLPPEAGGAATVVVCFEDVTELKAAEHDRGESLAL